MAKHISVNLLPEEGQQGDEHPLDRAHLREPGRVRVLLLAVGGADREALAEVVQADADRDQREVVLDDRHVAEQVAGAGEQPGIEGIETTYDAAAGEMTVNLPGDILFDFDKADIRPAAEGALKQVGDLIRSSALTQIAVSRLDEGGWQRIAAELGRPLAEHLGVFQRDRVEHLTPPPRLPLIAPRWFRAIATALLGPLDGNPRVLNNRIFMLNHPKYRDNAGAAGAYRPDLVERLGIEVPRSWDQVLRLAEERRRAEVARVGRDEAQRLGGGAEQDGVDRRLVLERHGTDRRRQGEDHVEVGHRQELGLALGSRLVVRVVRRDHA